MSENPYQSPNSNPNSQPPSNNSLAWMVFSWINVFLTLLYLSTIPQQEEFSIFDLLSHSVNIGAAIGILGFAYYKSVYKVAFWRYFFYVAIVDFVVNGLVIGLREVLKQEDALNILPVYVILMIYNLAVIYGLNQYAYKRPFIWR